MDRFGDVCCCGMYARAFAGDCLYVRASVLVNMCVRVSSPMSSMRVGANVNVSACARARVSECVHVCVLVSAHMCVL